MSRRKTIAFFPDGAFGPALNSVGIAQARQARGDRAVFLTDPGFGGVFEGYGFEECQVNLSEPLPAQEMAKYWSDFINAHILNFNKTPLRPDRHRQKDAPATRFHPRAHAIPRWYPESGIASR